ncbi:MAG: thiamine pyrophosphate-dependent dehydrogenase E1 component subunit alpha [Chthoniobacterales bacterium]
MSAATTASKKAPDVPDSADLESLIDKKQYLKAFRTMQLARVLEEKLGSLYRGGQIKGGVFLGRGQEALSVSVGINLRKGDIFAPLIRDQAGRMAFGDTVLDTLRTYLGSQLGSMRGRDGNIHRGRPDEGYLAMISHLGAMIPVVVGGLMARQMRGETGMVGATCIGDGATSTGAFHEGINIAAVEKAPLVLVVANNQYAYSTPNSRQFVCEDLTDKAIGYGVKVRRADGVDLGSCLVTVGAAVQDARDGQGPQMVVADLLRLTGHGEHDDARYVDSKLKTKHLGKDCLKVAEDFLQQKKWATEKEISDWHTECVDEVDRTTGKVLREPAPDPQQEDWTAFSSKETLNTNSEI